MDRPVFVISFQCTSKFLMPNTFRHGVSVEPCLVSCCEPFHVKDLYLIMFLRPNTITQSLPPFIYECTISSWWRIVAFFMHSIRVRKKNPEQIVCEWALSWIWILLCLHIYGDIMFVCGVYNIIIWFHISFHDRIPQNRNKIIHHQHDIWL